MSEHGRFEVRLITAACLVLAGLGVASAVSPSLETVLNQWLGVPILVAGCAAAVWVLGRQVWLWLLIGWELRRPLHPDELVQPERPSWEEAS
jgi:hypothetical protein